VTARATGGAGLAALVTQVEASRLAACIVFAPPIDGPWRDRLSDFSRRLAAPATVVIGVDGAGDDRPRGRLRRLFVRADAAVDTLPAGLPALRAALQADGVRVQVLHRQTGQLL
jgi:hypothetical protein